MTSIASTQTDEFLWLEDIDGAEQLGPLADNAAQLAGFVRRKLAFRDAAEDISEDVGAILGRLQRPQRKMDRCSSAGGNSPIDQEAGSIDVAVLGRRVKESVKQRIYVLDDLSIEAVPGLLGQSCPRSAALRQIEWSRERRISGSS